MPSYHEVRHYLGGIWLLVKGDARGLSAFDISDHGVLRSFWAFVWCLPATLVIWHSRQLDYIKAHPQNGDGVEAFAAKMVVVELGQWLVPTLAISLIALVLGLRPLIRILIITRNWFAMLLVYATSMTSLLDTLMPLPADDADFLGSYGSALLAILVLMVALVLNWRLLGTIVGGAAWARLLILTFTIAAELTVVSLLENMMGLEAL